MNMTIQSARPAEVEAWQKWHTQRQAHKIEVTESSNSNGSTEEEADGETVSGMMDDLRNGQSEQSTNLARQRAPGHITTEIDVDEDNGSPELENRDELVSLACRTS